MKRKILYFNKKNNDKIAYAQQTLSKNDNTADISRMKRILSKALDEELTKKQKACLVAYYLEGKKMKNIAQDMGVAPSTVTRHIQNAKNKLMNIAKYYM